MIEDVVGEFIRLARAGGVSLVLILFIIAVLAVLIVMAKRLNWHPAKPPPDPVENPPSPPIVLRPDGTIPVANPTEPPDPGPM